MDRLDAWITSGRYSKCEMLVTCPECEETTAVTSETEYGMTSWEPAECAHCSRQFTGSEDWCEDEGPDPYDRWEGSDDHLDGKAPF